METKRPESGARNGISLETFLVEWKLRRCRVLGTGSSSLETFLVEWKHAGIPALTGVWAFLETFLVEWKLSRGAWQAPWLGSLKPS